MKQLYRVVFPLVLVLIGASAWGQGIPVVEPETIGLSSERLERLTKVMQEHVDKKHIPGAVCIIARKGKIGYFETFGTQDMEDGTPMEEDTIFRIYSMSKAITGVAVMILNEENRFFLNEPVSKYLPELGGLEVAVEEKDPDTGESTITTVPSERDMSIRDLLRHTSGVTYGGGKVAKFYREAGVGDRDITIAQMVERLGKAPLSFEPGTAWEYGLSIDVLGRLVEVASGMGFDEFLEERIFGPLGMKDTAFYVPVQKHPRLVTLYSPDGEGKIRLSTSAAQDSYLTAPVRLSGGGGLVSTAMDYLRFCQMLLNNGELDGVRILGRKAVELMRTNHLGDIEKRGGLIGREGVGFGLTFAVTLDPGRAGSLGSAGEYSWGGAAGTRFWIDPEEELVGVFMVNILPHTALTYGTEFHLLTYQAIVD